MLSWKVGAVTVTRVVEMEMAIRYNAERPFLPDATPDALRRIGWLYPHFVDDSDAMRLSIHALLVEAPGLHLHRQRSAPAIPRRQAAGDGVPAGT